MSAANERSLGEELVRQRRAKNRSARRARRGNSAALRRQSRLNGIHRQGLHRVRVINRFNHPVDAEVLPR